MFIHGEITPSHFRKRRPQKRWSYCAEFILPALYLIENKIKNVLKCTTIWHKCFKAPRVDYVTTTAPQALERVCEFFSIQKAHWTCTNWLASIQKHWTFSKQLLICFHIFGNLLRVSSFNLSFIFFIFHFGNLNWFFFILY